MNKNRFQFLSILFVVLRIIFAPLILINVYLSTLGSLFLDGMDGLIFSKANVSRSSYQIIDKILDFYWYFWIFLYLTINSPGDFLYYLFTIFFLIRLVGEVFFLIKGKRKIFILFPNLFELFFWVYLLSNLLGLGALLLPPFLWFIIIICTVLKLFQEYLAHVANFSFFNFIFKRKVLVWKN